MLFEKTHLISTFGFPRDRCGDGPRGNYTVAGLCGHRIMVARPPLVEVRTGNENDPQSG